MSGPPLGWAGIVRLGLVQASIGAVVMLATSLFNRVMVVEYALPAAIPAGLVAWHYTVQLSRPIWGHGSDRGRRRTPWIVGGMAVLALGALLAADAIAMLAGHRTAGLALALLAFTMIGAGVGAAGTSLLALLAAEVAPARRAAAASVTWIMMVAGIAVTAGIAGGLLDPFSVPRLEVVSGGVALVAFVVSLGALWGVEGRAMAPPAAEGGPAPSFSAALREMRGDGDACRFTAFIFVSMLAYSMQDMILEPFAGLVFGFTPGQSTQLSGVQHGGVLAGMILVGLAGGAFGGRGAAGLRNWIVAGCVGSALALAGLALSARVGPGWPLAANIVLLGFSNGMFAVAAVGAMMALAGAGGKAREGIRMGVWGASQAVAFGLGGLTGAAGVDAGRALIDATDKAYMLVFGVEAGLFLLAAWLSLRAAGTPESGDEPLPLVGEFAS